MTTPLKPIDIVVVGHGRSPEGQNWGSKIDGCDTVVRLWDWEWQPETDYGRKYSYGLFVVTPKGLSIFDQNNKRQPNRGWLDYVGKPTVGPLPTTIPVEIIDTAKWVKLAQERWGAAGLTGQLTLTRGTVAAAWAICVAGEVVGGDSTVILVGFDNVRLGFHQPIEQSFCPDYWNLYMSRFKPDVEKTYPIGTSKTNTHDLQYELPLLQYLADSLRVKLQFAEDVWHG